jgi:hypothetical protein
MRAPMTLLATAFVLSALTPSVARAANAPSLATIPEVSLPEMLHPKDSPASLPATEMIEGIRISSVKHRQFGTVEGSDGRCLTLGSIAPGAVPSGNAQAMIRASSSALPLRVERFVGASSGKPELEISDGWVDMTSSGMREERKTRIPLTIIGSGPSGYSVYGFRSDGKLHVVFPTPQRFVAVDSFGKLGFVGCQHARLVLDPAASTGSLIRIAGMIESRRSAPKGLTAKSREIAQPMTLRGIEASVSISRTKRDREPLLSVTVGWSEDEPPMPLVGDAVQAQRFEGREPMPEAAQAMPVQIDEE